MRESLLTIEGLTKVFELRRPRARLWAVRNVSLDVGAGETLALVGETGSGKTTLGRCVLRLEQVTEGKISLRGTDITNLNRKGFQPFRRYVQAVFQDPSDSLNPLKKVRHILEEPLMHLTDLSRVDQERRIAETLDLVGLGSPILDRYPRQLTGANQQRVAVARALVTRPALIVLDEPTSRLDVSVRALLLSLLARLQKELGIAYLFISHDLTAVRTISQRIAVMYLGEVVEVGETGAVFGHPVHPYSQALLSAVLYPDPAQPPGGVELVGEIPSPINLPKACSLAPRCPFAKDICSTVKPPLIQVGDRKAACHFAENFFSTPVLPARPPARRLMNAGDEKIQHEMPTAEGGGVGA
jgi:peptide/nickel transport system ATP-binding protein